MMDRLKSLGGWGVWALGALLILTTGCGQPEEKTAGRMVFVSILPYAYFVQKIGGNRIQVQVLVSPGKDPHDYEPTPRQIMQLAHAQILFSAGMPFETALIPKITQLMPRVRIVDLRSGIPLRRMEAHHRPDPAQTGRAEIDTAAMGMDPHVWLNPMFAKRQVQTILQALTESDPSGQEGYQNRAAQLLQELDQLQQDLSIALEPVRGKSFYVFHPAYGYLADAYGLTQVAVEAEGKEPVGRALTEFIRQAEAQGMKTIFVQPQFSSQSAEAIAQAVGADVQTLDALAFDYPNNLRDIAAKLKAALHGER